MTFHAEPRTWVKIVEGKYATQVARVDKVNKGSFGKVWVDVIILDGTESEWSEYWDHTTGPSTRPEIIKTGERTKYKVVRVRESDLVHSDGPSSEG